MPSWYVIIMCIAMYYMKYYKLCLGCTQGDIILVDGSNELEGRVEVCLSNSWNTICHDGWGIEDSMVVCRQLGYSIAGLVLYFHKE